MKILLLGGPKFLGRAVIDAALAAGHTVTLFNRGQTNPELYPDVEKLHGDRDSQLDALRGRSWDAVIDTSGYVPRVVRQSVDLLADAVGQYVFISTISVYQDIAGASEESPLIALEDEATEDVSAAYGGLKVLCERAVQDLYGDRAVVIRPGLIVGPHDPTDRFTYWVTRAARGGVMLVPETPDYPMQVIDARDLAEWTIRMVERGASGVYNATGPAERLTLGEMLATCARAAGSEVEYVWADADFLLAQGVAPWSELPLWLPDTEWATSDIRRALAAGLTFRPLVEIARDTLHWIQQEPPEAPRAGLTAEREAELLAAWAQR